MPRKCPHCNESLISKPISKLPLWEGAPLKSKFNWEALKWRNLNIKNLIIGDVMSLMIIWTVLFVAWAYSHDSAAYREIYNDPCNYVMKNIDTCIEFNKTNTSLYINPNLLIQEFNQTELELMEVN